MHNVLIKGDRTCSGLQFTFSLRRVVLCARPCTCDAGMASWNSVYDVLLNTVIPCLHFVILGSEGSHRRFPHHSPRMDPHHLHLCLISCGAHQLSLVSRIPLMGPRRHLPCLIWYAVHQYLMKIPLLVCLLNPLDPFANHRTWLHFGLVGKRHEPEIF